MSSTLGDARIRSFHVSRNLSLKRFTTPEGTVCLAQKNRERIHTLLWQVRTRCQAVYDNEHTMTLRKRHPALRLLKHDWWIGANRLQHDVTCLGPCIVTAICLLIQSNCSELRPSIYILMWAVRLFDHCISKHTKISINLQQTLTLTRQVSTLTGFICRAILTVFETRASKGLTTPYWSLFVMYWSHSKLKLKQM
jgi:hypothetical protein